MKKAWYKEGVVYQIYPRSFKDSNGDGIGDIRGIIEKLDYLKELGISIVWLSPVYQSPNDDNGYDISDYRDIMDDFGKLDDWKEMIKGLHDRNIKLVMDLVVNHTSDEHPWFIESKKSKDNPFRNYYIWRKGNGRKKPNNWTSFFTGSVWEYDQTTDEYYMHLFSKKQPDLNWDNPKVRHEVKDIIKYWLDLGVDGFRCDVINIISKKEGLPDGKFSLGLIGSEHYMNGPHVHEYLREINKGVLSKYDCFTVGEAVFVSTKDALSYVDEKRNELSMIFHFDHMNVDNIFKWFIRPFKLPKLKKVLSKWQNDINGKGWNSLYLENHDQPRIVSRWGDDKKYRVESAKMLSTMIYFQQGTPYIYQGQEIGMTNAYFSELSQYKDVETHNIYKLGREKLHISHRRMMKKFQYMSRDNARTPMQWSDKIYAGFSTNKPWIEVNTNYKTINVENAIVDKCSIYHYYKKIIALRKEYEIIIYGDYKEHDIKNKYLYIYERNLNDEKLLVITSFTSKKILFSLPKSIKYKRATLLLSNYEVMDDLNKFKTRPYEARVYLLK
ncbi:alpha-glucosidase [Mycoplasmatota bacterium]|nr:alpha-glucosidase [Mycoplasmatota bacterium]